MKRRPVGSSLKSLIILSQFEIKNINKLLSYLLFNVSYKTIRILLTDSNYIEQESSVKFRPAVAPYSG